MKICFYGASSDAIHEDYKDAAFQLGAECARRGHRFVFGGGRAGLMGAAARGALSEGGNITGVTPTLFMDSGDIFDSCTDIVVTDNMRDRKKVMSEISDAFVVLPGGIGTLDEMFETLTAKQLGLMVKPIVIFNFGGFYDSLNDVLVKAAEEHFLRKECGSLVFSTANVRDVFRYIENYTAPDARRHR